MVHIECIFTGNELLDGRVVNTNLKAISDAFKLLSGWIIASHTVRDDVGEIQRCIEDSLKRTKVLLICGGMGPTSDDCTVEAFAKALGVPLIEHEDRYQHLQYIYQRINRSMPDANLKQVLAPEGSVMMANPIGTAAGIYFKKDDTHVFCVPGVPGECIKMVKEGVCPILRDYFGGTQTRLSKMFKCLISESELADRVAALDIDSACVSYQCSFPEVRLMAQGSSDTQADFDQMVLVLRAALKDVVLVEDEEEYLHYWVNRMRKKNLTIALAESCTGGMLAHLLTGVPGASDILKEGVVCYSNRSKVSRGLVSQQDLDKKGAVSERVALSLAESIRVQNESDIGVGITGVAGPDGGTVDKPVGTVCVAWVYQDQCHVETLRLVGYSRRLIQIKTCYVVLDRLNRMFD